ncbi:MAG: hypothetical protein J6J33_04455 [Clostridia bacterium]|nr:hypothetical protein [Clostridia bacterium]
MKKVAEPATQKQPVNSNLQETKAETIDFSSVKSSLEPSKELDAGFKILGEMLMHFRKNRLMPLLMISRTIQKIEISDGVAEISSEQNEIEQLISNENYKAEMDKFMKEHGLSFKIKEKEYKVSPIDVLNELVGGKLVIK